MGLQKFIDAHKRDYEIAKKELLNGRKETHWMWYIFPQLKGLGNSRASDFYGINNTEEAKEYYNHPVLGKHLEELFGILLNLPTSNIKSVMSSPDDLKLKSCATLFLLVARSKGAAKILNKYYNGNVDHKTITLLNRKGK